MKSNGIYGGDESRPSSDASDAAWRTFIANKYEHRLLKQRTRSHDDKPKQTSSSSDDGALLTFDTDAAVTTVHVHMDKANISKMNASNDFFAQFGV
mmetsp:Transcript_4820/g.2851  ORF Transcript_4820/g.2851 Transcript_4820/m.2851 type:complete len:96 (+) Transcript_4820:1-288(+)